MGKNNGCISLQANNVTGSEISKQHSHAQNYFRLICFLECDSGVLLFNSVHVRRLWFGRAD